MNTLGQLKLELLHRGVAFAQNVRSHDLVAPGIFPEGDGQGIALSLTEDFFVRPRVNPDKDAAVLMDIQNDKVMLNLEQGPLEVGVIPAPLFLKAPQASRNPAASCIQLDGYCLNVNLHLEDPTRQLNLSLEDTIRLIRAAFQEGVADLVQLNMDHCVEKDRGFSRLAPLVQSIKKNFRTFVALRGYPPDDLGVIDSFYAAGVDLIVFPLEQYDEDGLPQPAVSAKQGMKGLEYAAGVFGPGTVPPSWRWTLQTPATPARKNHRPVETGDSASGQNSRTGIAFKRRTAGNPACGRTSAKKLHRRKN